MEGSGGGGKCSKRHMEWGFKACSFVFIQRDQRAFLMLIVSIFTLYPYCTSIQPLRLMFGKLFSSLFLSSQMPHHFYLGSPVSCLSLCRSRNTVLQRTPAAPLCHPLSSTVQRRSWEAASWPGASSARLLCRKLKPSDRVLSSRA